MHTFLLSLFLMVSGCLYAQNTVILQGRVLNDTIDNASLTVVNISLKKGVVTNEAGVFEIPVRVHDTIHISAVQYESREFVVNQTMFNRKKISLYLIPKITELDEVEISNIDLSGDIRKDALDTALTPSITAESLGLPRNRHKTFTPEERRLYSATGGAGLLGMLINAISGRTKMLKKHLEVAAFQLEVEKARDTFSDTLYMKSLNIPEALIDDFVYFVFEEKEAEAKASDEHVLELLDYMLEKSKVYLTSKEKEGSIKTTKNNE